jgi:uncharacterized protein (DUF2062 family)
MMKKISLFLKKLWHKLVGIKDSPHKIAAGFGLGVFLGVLPGTGPIASVAIAAILRINKVSALLGCLLFNTWINIVTFTLAAQIGSLTIGLDWRKVYSEWIMLFKNFSFKVFFGHILAKSFVALAIGYLIIGAVLGLLGYILVLAIISGRQNKSKYRGRQGQSLK